ncbi:CHASE2 domain-containing protein [Spirochaeta isovalerica]|uniref:Adenylate cyclase n=1 Tax=Spirochaeta isovalerica TaxID=150 RepID=A0A841RAQ9_9SPIO|nr:adenylate/guanylate cyclase domain-containing protein [Spirochaeta isovalerica]MBB6480009.1 adenylate cyclase [Spirochaeta isovalerica]
MKKKQKWILVPLLALASLALVVIFPFSGISELKSRDLRASLAGLNEASAPLTIVTIDDESFEKINIRWPWPRQILAESIINLKDAGASVIGLDIMLGDGGYTADEDRALASALNYAGNVVLPEKRDVRESGGYVIDYFDRPLPLFAEGAQAIGYVNLIIDRDNFVRRVLPADSSLGESHEAFSFKLYPQAAPLLNVDRTLLINYAPAGSFTTVPFHKVLDGSADPELFRDRIVLVGAWFKESHDRSLTPVESSTGLYGIEIHANIVNTLYTGRYLREIPGMVNLLILLLLSAAGSLAFIHLRPLAGLITAAAAVVLFSFLAFFLYTSMGTIVDIFNPLLIIFITWLGAVLYNYLIVEREKAHVRRTFSRYVSAEVVNNILDSGNAIELGGELREVAIFFSDICGFTSMSEKMPPDEIVEMLNEYFTDMTDIIFQYGGTLNKYIGDAIMAIYGAPVAMVDASERALKACLDMRSRLERFNRDRAEKGKPPIRIGMGIHSGKVLVGNIGSPRQMEYTVIGDAVNVCSRIEGLTRDFETDLLISDELFQKVGHLVEVETMAPVAVKGKSDKIIVHKVTGLKEGI